MPTPTDTLTALLAEQLPLHGPYSPDASIAAADAGSELIRYLNHATAHPEAVPHPATAARVLAAVGEMVDRLPQLGRQLAARTALAAATPHAYVFRDGARDHDPAAVADQVNQLRDQLDAAGQLAVALGRHLSTAQTLANRIGSGEPDSQDTR